MTEDRIGAPAWLDARLDDVFAGTGAGQARSRYAECLARLKSPAAPSDMLGAEFGPCRTQLRRDLQESGLTDTVIAEIEDALNAVEAELATES
ncbi:MAG: hypothetical protein ABW026_10340 [Microvirga sp.]